MKSRINSQHEDISSHLLLSIFKIAEVDVVYPAPPSSAITSHRPYVILYIIIILITLLHNFKIVAPTKNIVNFITNLFVTITYLSSYLNVPLFVERYILNFLKIFNEEFTTDVDLVSHDALASIQAQIELTDVKVDVSEIDVTIDNHKKMIHIVKAVNITIFDNFNKLVADAIISKYFSRDVYYEIECTTVTKSMLFDFGVASSSTGVESVSLV